MTATTTLDAQIQHLVRLASENRGRGVNVTILPLAMVGALRVARERGLVAVVTRPGRLAGSTHDFLVLPQA